MKILTLFTVTMPLVSCCPAFAQNVSHETSIKSPYDIAIDYCRDRGGLAQYSVSGNTITFSCSDDLTDVIAIVYE